MQAISRNESPLKAWFSVASIVVTADDDDACLTRRGTLEACIVIKYSNLAQGNKATYMIWKVV